MYGTDFPKFRDIRTYFAAKEKGKCLKIFKDRKEAYRFADRMFTKYGKHIDISPVSGKLRGGKLECNGKEVKVV